MSDGTILYADHYYPPGKKSSPTLLMRQPYGRDIASTVVYAHPTWFARQGYNVVIQDVRGRGDSEGDFYPFRHEGRDGAETIAFIRNRSECNGRIGMYGFSYQGMTQLLAAAEDPPGLQCIAPAMTAHDLYNGWFYHHGALRLASSLGWGLQMLKEDARRRGLHAASDRLERAWANLPMQYLETPYGTHTAIQSAGLPTYVVDWFEQDEPGSYWHDMDISKAVEKIRIPALHLSGWYDTYLKGSIDGFLALTSQAGTAHARDNQYLLAGPWVHIPWGNRIGLHYLGSEAAFDTDALLLRWLNHWLKDTNEFAAEPRIRHFALNEDRWHSANTWPSTPNEILYLHSNGRANSSKGNGILTKHQCSPDETPDVFVHDPEVPVAAPGGFASVAGPSNQVALELGNNLLVYTSEPLEIPLRIFGSPQISVYLSTSAAEVDLIVKLICLHPAGEAQFISIGIARSCYLFGDHYAQDSLFHWKFPLEPTSCVFAIGTRLRIEIAGSAYPLYDRNPGNATAPRLASAWNWQRSTHTVFHDAARPSALHLPVISADKRRAE
jgi:putative CocE/NonD family hydrolase